MDITSIVSKVAPGLGAALAGPAGGFIGTMISQVLGVDMKKPDELEEKLKNDPECSAKLKELELQLTDMQRARDQASKDTGCLRFVRPLLALAAMFAIFADILLIKYVVEDEIVKDILIFMMVFLIWDVRQIYKFYFGNEEEVPSFLLKRRKF